MCLDPMELAWGPLNVFASTLENTVIGQHMKS